MPSITKTLFLEVTPEQFLEACTPSELMEVDILIQGAHFQNKMNEEKKFRDFSEDLYNGITEDEAAAGQLAIDKLKETFTQQP